MEIIGSLIVNVLHLVNLKHMDEEKNCVYWVLTGVPNV